MEGEVFEGYGANLMELEGGEEGESGGRVGVESLCRCFRSMAMLRWQVDARVIGIQLGGCEAACVGFGLCDCHCGILLYAEANSRRR